MKFTQRLESLADVVGLKHDGRGAAASGDLFSSDISTSSRLHQSYRLPDAKSGPPNILVPAGYDHEELFAAVATYYPSLSPLTAQTYVLGREVEADWKDRDADGQRGGTVGRGHLACLGASLGETTLASMGGPEVGSVLAPSYSDTRRSLSYVLARATMLFPNIEPEVACSRWLDLRGATGLACDEILSAAVRTVHAAAFGLHTSEEAAVVSHKPLWDALSAHIRHATGARTVGEALVQTYPAIDAHLSDLRGTFDGRMKALLDIFAAIQASSRGPQVDSVAAAFFCNEVLPASFAHVKVLARLVPFFPTALVWYGVFAVMATQFDPLDFGSGIVLKLVREVERPFSFSERPQCDLSIEELRVLSRLPLRSEVVKPVQHRIMEVAVLPGVNVAARFSSDAEPQGAPRKALEQAELHRDAMGAAARLLEEALSLLREANPTKRDAIAPANKKSKRSRA